MFADIPTDKMSSEKGREQISVQEHKLYYNYYYHFGRHWENKKFTKWQQDSMNQSRECSGTSWMAFIFPQWKYTLLWN